MLQEQRSTVPSEGEASQPSRPELRLFQHDTLVSTFPLREEGVMLGKASNNDVVVPMEYASRVHLRLFLRQGRWYVEDVGSTNGTFVYQDDQLLYSSTHDAAPCPLSDGQEIRFGPQPTAWRLLFRDPTTTARPASLYIDEKKRQVWVRGRLIRLPRDHYTVLLQLYQAAPYPCSYDALCDAIERNRKEREKTASTQFYDPSVASIHQLVHRLRSRIELDPRHPTLLIQAPHFGYRLNIHG